MTIDDFTIYIMMICTITRASVTSWIRTKKHNAEVGGKDTSLHLLGLAVDVVLDNIGDGPLLEGLCSRYGLHFLKETDHYHIQDRPAL